MTWSPDDLERRTFGRAENGYDPAEVDQFLHDVAAQLRARLGDGSAGTGENEAEAEALRAASRRERIEAVRTAHQLIERAREEAQGILDKALGDRERVTERLTAVSAQLLRAERTLVAALGVTSPGDGSPPA